jgi:hypothetical protein
MTKKQITHLTKLNIPIEKYFGGFRYYNYRLRGRMKKYLLMWHKKYSV